MHELSVTQSILDIALRYAAEANAIRVTDLKLVIGQLSSIIDDSVQFYWDMISQGTLCEGAKLHFTRIPTTLLCLDCSQTYTLNREMTGCPNCGSERVRVTAGEEFYLENITIEQN